MKFGITLIIIGVVMLGGNLLYVPHPVVWWALVVRFSISIGFLSWGILRVVGRHSPS